MTGLARAGKTAFLTSVAANLLAGKLPLLAAARARATLSPMGAGPVPRFELARHLAALSADPPAWPERTGAVSLLSLDLAIPRRIGRDRRLRLEFLDYPGEWLLDLPLLRTNFADWSTATLRRLETPALAAFSRDFLAFASALPAGAGAQDALARQGHVLYRDLLARLREAEGFSLLQPGRFLMPAPGPPPPWTVFFPWSGRGPLATVLAARFDAYRDAVQHDLVSPLFGRVDRLVVLADMLGALHAGQAAFEDAAGALRTAAGALRWRRSWWELAGSLVQGRWSGRGISRIGYAATKSDHVAAGQRGNLTAMVRNLTDAPGDVPSRPFAIASVRCTQDGVMNLGGRAVSAVEGVKAGVGRIRSYPGEVPDGTPADAFWSQPFFDLPEFLPPRLLPGAGVPMLGLNELLAYILEDAL